MNDTYTQCDWCQTSIAYGNAAVTINKNIEQMDRTSEHPDGIVTVIQSDVVTTLCASCGNRLYVDDLQKILSMPISKKRSTKNAQKPHTKRTTRRARKR
jgi:hypothetical protein